MILSTYAKLALIEKASWAKAALFLARAHRRTRGQSLTPRRPQA
ncbi:hypothetical protein RLDS_15770 [Sphingobium lactosutens DS20]|uniref:Uncharacterized protein n=1 Tax=Sphingobium lactosutens DS20 TaxID=1331060 RepID=T0HKJ1_9SPHN|nr:hypothetical protein RLDS_15770 [Sphingobium lactosutens DS20]